MANPFTRRHLTDQLENGIALLLKFVVFMGKSLDVNKTQKDDCFTIVFFIIDFWKYLLTSEHTIGC